jgi:hypothetical protein
LTKGPASTIQNSCFGFLEKLESIFVSPPKINTSISKFEYPKRVATNPWANSCIATRKYNKNKTVKLSISKKGKKERTEARNTKIITSQ